MASRGEAKAGDTTGKRPLPEPSGGTPDAKFGMGDNPNPVAGCISCAAFPVSAPNMSADGSKKNGDGDGDDGMDGAAQTVPPASAKSDDASSGGKEPKIEEDKEHLEKVRNAFKDLLASPTTRRNDGRIVETANPQFRAELSPVLAKLQHQTRRADHASQPAVLKTRLDVLQGQVRPEFVLGPAPRSCQRRYLATTPKDTANHATVATSVAMTTDQAEQGNKLSVSGHRGKARAEAAFENAEKTSAPEDGGGAAAALRAQQPRGYSTAEHLAGRTASARARCSGTAPVRWSQWLPPGSRVPSAMLRRWPKRAHELLVLERRC